MKTYFDEATDKRLLEAQTEEEVKAIIAETPEAEKLADKICKLRIFADDGGKTNLSINDVGGDMLIISQFTLLADCHHGNRPSFTGAGKPDEANRLYELFCGLCAERINGKVAKGVFGADMSVSLVNDGPFTIVLECRNGEILA